MSKLTEDWQLLETYGREHSQEAFARLVAKYSDMVFHTAVRRTHSYPLAEDVTQAVFIVLARSARSLRRTGSLGAWLHKTALHASSNALRSESRRRRHECDAARPESLSAPADDEMTQTALAVEEELHRLSAADEQVLALHYLEGRTMPEAAELLGIPLETARKRLTRALDRLRKRLARRGTSADSQTISSVVGGFGANRTHTPAGHITSQAVAGGQKGNAFTLASNLLRTMRLQMLGKAAAAVVMVSLLVAIVAVAAAKGPSTLSVQTPPLRPATTQAAVVLKLPDAIRDALVRNTQQLNPITIAWDEHTSSPLSVEKYASLTKRLLSIVDSDINGVRHTSFTYQDGKYHGRLVQDPRRSRFDPDAAAGLYVEDSYDGQILYDGNGTITGKQATIVKSHIEHLGSGEGAVSNGALYFLDIGLMPAVRADDVRNHSTAGHSEIMNLLDKGAILTDIDDVEVDGHRLTYLRLILDNPSYRPGAEKIARDAQVKDWASVGMSKEQIAIEIAKIKFAPHGPAKIVKIFYVDPQLNFAVRRWEMRDGDDALLVRADCDSFERLPGRDVCLPRKCTLSSFGTHDGILKQPTRTTTYSVTKIEVDRVPETTFVLHEAPGTYVIDSTDPAHQKHGIVQKDGTLREPPQPKPHMPPATRESSPDSDL